MLGVFGGGRGARGRVDGSFSGPVIPPPKGSLLPPLSSKHALLLELLESPSLALARARGGVEVLSSLLSFRLGRPPVP